MLLLKNFIFLGFSGTKNNDIYIYKSSVACFQMITELDDEITDWIKAKDNLEEFLIFFRNFDVRITSLNRILAFF